MSKSKIKTIKLTGNHIDTIAEVITDVLDSYLTEHLSYAVADIYPITSMLETLYLLGHKKEAISYCKQFKDYLVYVTIREDYGYDEDARDAINELKKIKFKKRLS